VSVREPSNVGALSRSETPTMRLLLSNGLIDSKEIAGIGLSNYSLRT